MTADNHNPSRVARNTTYMTIALIIQKILSFFYYAYIARSIGDVGLGKYTFALAFASIFVIFMDFGLGPVLTREGARDESKIKGYISNILGIKIVLTILSLVGMFVVLHVINLNGSIPADTIQLTYLAALIIVFDTFTFTFYTVFRALQRLKYETFGIVIYQTIIVAFGAVAIFLGAPLYFLILAILAGSIFNFVWSFSWVVIKAKIKPRIKLTKEWAKNLLKISAPFALAGIFFKLNGSIDTIMLETLAGEKYVGWYSVAFKLTFALTVLPGAFATSFYPAMSHYFMHNKKELAQLFEKAMFYLIIISLPIAVGAGILAETIVVYIYGPVFGAAGMALQVFMLGLIFTFCNYPVGNLLNACNKQTLNTLNMGIALIINIVLNLILIPKLNYMGASIAAVVSSVVLIALGLPWVSKVVKYSVKYIVLKLVKALIAAAVMGAFVYFLQDVLHFLIVIPLSVIVYLIAILLVGAVTKEELRSLFKSALNRA